MNQVCRVIVNGANGKMGKIAIKAIEQEPSLVLASGLGRHDNLTQCLKQHSADIIIDFTTPDIVRCNTQLYIDHDIHPIIGTSGLLPPDIEHFRRQCQEKKLGALIIPNFCISAILMMHFSQQAAPYFDHVEIIEHHQKEKKDAPSGTARKTAQLITSSNHDLRIKKKDGRGDQSTGISIHSQRTPQQHARQTVDFNNTHEQLSITSSCYDRHSYQKGIIFACRQVTQITTLYDNLADLILKQF